MGCSWRLRIELRGRKSLSQMLTFRMSSSAKDALLRSERVGPGVKAMKPRTKSGRPLPATNGKKATRAAVHHYSTFPMGMVSSSQRAQGLTIFGRQTDLSGEEKV